MRLLLLRLLFPLVIALASCAPPPPRAVLAPDMDAVLLRRLQTMSGAFESLRGMAKVRIETGGQSYSSSQIVLLRRPAHLRLEALSPFGNPVLVAVADDADLSVLLPTEGRFLQGPATYSNLARFTRLPVQLTDLVRLLLYDVPVIPYEEAVVFAGEGGGYRLVLQGADAVRQELEFDRQLRLRQSRYLEAGEMVLQVGFGNFAGDSPFPRSFTLNAPGESTAATLAFSEVDVNVALPADRFRLSPPPGYVVEPLP